MIHEHLSQFCHTFSRHVGQGYIVIRSGATDLEQNYDKQPQESQSPWAFFLRAGL